MVKRKGSFGRRTRNKLQKSVRTKGKISQRRFFQKLNEGDIVQLVAEPALRSSGMYWPRFHGLVGVVKGKQGECYNVMIKDKAMEKTLIIHPVHLRKAD